MVGVRRKTLPVAVTLNLFATIFLVFCFDFMLFIGLNLGN